MDNHLSDSVQMQDLRPSQLETLPEDRRGFNLPALCPPHWWYV